MTIDAPQPAETGRRFEAGAKIVPLLLLTLLALVLRLYDLGGKSLWGDELNMIGYAIGEHPIERLAGNGLGYLKILSLIDTVAPRQPIGAADAWFRFPAALFGTATVALLYLVGCRIAGARVGAHAAILLAVSPIHVAHSQEVHSYAAFCLVALAGYEYTVAPHRHRGWILALLFGIGIYCHHFVLFVAGALAIVAVVLRRRDGRPALPDAVERRRLLLGSGLALALSWPMWSQWIVPFTVRLVRRRLGLDTAPPVLGTEIFNYPPSFEIGHETLLRAGNQLVNWRGPFPGFAMVCWLLFALGVAVLARRRSRDTWPVVLFFVLPLAPMVAFSYAARFDFGTRRLLFLVPLFWLVVAVALVAIGDALAKRLARGTRTRAWIARAPAGLLVAWLAATDLGWYYLSSEKTDIRLVCQMADRLGRAGDRLSVYNAENRAFYYRTAVPLRTQPSQPEDVAWVAATPDGLVAWARPFNVDTWRGYSRAFELMQKHDAFDFAIGGGWRIAILAKDRASTQREAERWLRTAIDLRPGRGSYHEVLATCLEARGETTEAATEHARAVALDPVRRFPTCLPWGCGASRILR